MVSEQYYGDFREWNLRFLLRFLGMLDSELKSLDAKISDSVDAETEGICDHIEEVVGLGFAACQRHITSVASLTGTTRRYALKSGPLLACGLTIAEAVDHVANYWKHHDEWDVDPPSKQSDRTREGLMMIGVERDDPYSATEALEILAGGEIPRLSTLVPKLNEWMDSL